MQYWQRQYKVSFPDINYEIADSLRIKFDIDKDLTHESNKSKLKIYNLSDASRKKIEIADLKCDLYVGYEKNGGAAKIFTGTVIEGRTQDDGKDAVTELRLSDGQIAIRDSVFSLSFAPGVTGDTVLKAVAANMGLPLLYGDNVQFGTFANGYSFVGNGTTALTEICYGSGCDWSIQNGILQIILAGGVVANRGIVFSASSGLIGSPERIIKSNYKENKETPKRKRRQKAKWEKPKKKAGWRIKTLLSPTVNSGDVIKVESCLIDGWFRVESIKHSGDSHGGDWMSEFEIIEGLG